VREESVDAYPVADVDAHYVVPTPPVHIPPARIPPVRTTPLNTAPVRIPPVRTTPVNTAPVGIAPISRSDTASVRETAALRDTASESEATRHKAGPHLLNIQLQLNSRPCPYTDADLNTSQGRTTHFLWGGQMGIWICLSL